VGSIVFHFVFYPELQPGYVGNWPTIYVKQDLPAKKAAALIKRCAAAAAAWAAAAGLPQLEGAPCDVRAAEIYRAEWLRQRMGAPRSLRAERSARSWLMYMDSEMIDD
jgi:hypothetical protein